MKRITDKVVIRLALRRAFGWADQYGHIPVIDPETGNEGTFEETLGSAMRRLSRHEGHMATTPKGFQAMVPRDNESFKGLREERAMILLNRLAHGQMCRTECLDHLGIAEGPYWAHIRQLLLDAGCIVMTYQPCNGGRRTIYSITDAGRRAVAMQQVAAE